MEKNFSTIYWQILKPLKRKFRECFQTSLDAMMRCLQCVFSQTLTRRLIRTHSIFLKWDGKERTNCSPRRNVNSTILFWKVQKYNVLRLKHIQYSLQQYCCSVVEKSPTSNGKSCTVASFVLPWKNSIFAFTYRFFSSWNSCMSHLCIHRMTIHTGGSRL